jgi:hypothetical protein
MQQRWIAAANQALSVISLQQVADVNHRRLKALTRLFP